MALGKAVVLPPKVLLLDEPLAHLDPPARARAREELRQLHEELGTTTIHVTHDLADLVAVMQAGRFVQTGTPKDIRNHPKNAFVADFVRSYQDSLHRAFSN
ncbi:hypothetical protein H5T52_07945 [Candidatus Bipolaricaulota bacterium]|nr:hypothetical protein [Candidatus Bipolaricaulota bacterium]